MTGFTCAWCVFEIKMKITKFAFSEIRDRLKSIDMYPTRFSCIFSPRRVWCYIYNIYAYIDAPIYLPSSNEFLIDLSLRPYHAHLTRSYELLGSFCVYREAVNYENHINRLLFIFIRNTINCEITLFSYK